MTERAVRKTYKLYINGEFVRSESGRAYHSEELPMVNLPAGSRKDLREAVRSARSAFSGWSGKTAMNRGQILYRIAEMLDARSTEFTGLLGGKSRSQEVEDAVDAFVWYAGWTDKLSQVLGTVNPVAGPYFTFTIPEPTGVVGIILPERPALLSLARSLAPVLCSGNTAVVLARSRDCRVALTFGEILSTSDVPAGVVNILSDPSRELHPWLAAHMDVNAIDASGCTDEEFSLIQNRAAENVKRVVRRNGPAPLTPYAIAETLEFKTVWHPIGK